MHIGVGSVTFHTTLCAEKAPTRVFFYIYTENVEISVNFSGSV